MGREIRRVPPNWEHPKDRSGRNFQPLFDRDFESAATDWYESLKNFQEKYPGGFSERGNAFWEHEDMPPDRDYYRPKWTPEEATAYQVYETVSEGTPVSPVFGSEDELRQWLMSTAGLSEGAAIDFIRRGFSFSGIIGGGTVAFGWGAAEAMSRMDHDGQED
jgi:hypothetical protein